MLLAIWAVSTQAVVPLSKGVSFLMTSHKLKANRPRAMMSTLGFMAAMVVLLFVMPFPHRTIVDGVTWPSDRSQIRAQSEGFVAEIPIKSRTSASKGDPVQAKGLPEVLRR